MHSRLIPQQQQQALPNRGSSVNMRQRCCRGRSCVQNHTIHSPSASHHSTLSSSSSTRSSIRTAASALDKLNIQPLSVPEEARQLTTATAPHEQQQQHLHIPPLDAWGQDAFLMSGCEPDSAPLRVAVLVSGGVDSSLALKLVTAAGHAATAFYLQIWFQEDFRNFWDACPWEEDLQYAQAVCDDLGVPLVVVPLTQQYWDRVVSHSVAEIKEGRTPNPDMLCNSRVKFGAFVEYLQQEHAGSFDRIASGHYAKVQRRGAGAVDAVDGASDSNGSSSSTCQSQPPQQHAGADAASANDASSSPDGVEVAAALSERQSSHALASSSSNGSSSHSHPQRPRPNRLLMVPDAVKDQTYFLANLSPSQLATCMFPLGSFTKPQVRALASAAGLATSGRKDSQGICFLGKVKFGEFVGQHLGEWPGPLVEEDSGQVVGVHDGYWFYTVGQRGGIKLPGGPWYVTQKDMAANIVYVSRTYYERERRRDAFVCGPFNWLGASRPQQQDQQQQQGQGLLAAPSPPLMVKVRHGPTMYECSLRLGSRQDVMAVLEQGTHAAFEAPQPPLLLDAVAGSVPAADVPQPPSQQQQTGGSIGTTAAAAGTNELQEEPGAYGVVLLSENDQGLAAGQYAVFYQGGECLGSAQIVGGLAARTGSQR